MLGRGIGELGEKMDIRFHELSAQHSVASMPVEGNRQPVGILHGGAHVVLAESMGSIAANIHAGAGRIAMGIELNASHSRSVREGFVIATCDAINLGSTLATHEIVVRDESGRRLSTVRITNILTEKR
ncbi:hotdog fold thioesterase [Microbacteriaceae bacterium VKM Ac-2855]|nr:hotdog fold thioesterase [Microbacteriaceae bacterium VKM Ac-2855]